MRLLPFAEFTKTRGLRGELRGRILTDGNILNQVTTLYNNDEMFEIQRILPDKNDMAFFTLKNIDTPEKANALVGKQLSFDADTVELPEDAVYIDDLIGISVYDAHSKEHYGTVSDVCQYGAADVIVISDDMMFPNIPEVVKNIDLTERKMFIEPMKEYEDED